LEQWGKNFPLSPKDYHFVGKMGDNIVCDRQNQNFLLNPKGVIILGMKGIKISGNREAVKLLLFLHLLWNKGH
jgi:hypothetical protein